MLWTMGRVFGILGGMTSDRDFSGSSCPPPLDLVVVGSVGLDDIRTPAETRECVTGGAGTYACAAASFFASTGIVAVVGDDFDCDCESWLSRFGVDREGLARRPGRTFRWSGVYEDDFVNRRTLSTELGVFADFNPILPENYRKAGYLLLGNIGPELQWNVVEQARPDAFVAVDTMDLWINTQREALLRVIGRASLLTLNDAEARLLTGCHQLRDCAEALMEMGPPAVAIKKGEHGALLFTEEGISILPAYPVKRLSDPTGAGDLFAGACLGYLAARKAADRASILTGMVYGSVVASFGVESFGLDGLAELDMSSIEGRVAELREMSRC